MTNEKRLLFTAQVIIDGDIAWKLFTKSWRRKDVTNHVTINGETALAAPVLDMIAVMA